MITLHSSKVQNWDQRMECSRAWGRPLDKRSSAFSPRSFVIAGWLEFKTVMFLKHLEKGASCRQDIVTN